MMPLSKRMRSTLKEAILSRTTGPPMVPPCCIVVGASSRLLFLAK